MYTKMANMDFQKSRISYKRMIIFGVVLVMPTFLSAVNQTFPAIALPQMNLDINAASWFASVAILASPISVIIVGLLIDRFGRKVTLLYCIAPSIGGWLLFYWSNNNVTLLLLGQALNGLTMNAGFYPVQVYAGECIMADNIRMRNIFMTWISLSTSFGTTLTLIMGNLFDYHKICLIFSVMCISMLTIFFLIMPESPVWLYQKGRVGDAEWSQKRLGMTRSILVSTRKQSYQPFMKNENSFAQKLKKIARPDVYKPTIILTLTSILLSWCGTSTVITYMINVIQNTIPGVETNLTQMSTGNDFLSKIINEKVLDAQAETQLSYQLSLFSGFSMCLGSLLSVFVLPRMGLKKMLMTSKFCLILAMLVVTYGSETQSDNQTVVRFIGVTIMTFLFGLESGPRVSFAGDVFPVDAKGFASIPALSGSASIALCNKLFPYLRLEFGGYVYCFFAAMCLVGVFFIHFFIPEVVGRTLEDIRKDYADDE